MLNYTQQNIDDLFDLICEHDTQNELDYNVSLCGCERNIKKWADNKETAYNKMIKIFGEPTDKNAYQWEYKLNIKSKDDDEARTINITFSLNPSDYMYYFEGKYWKKILTSLIDISSVLCVINDYKTSDTFVDIINIYDNIYALPMSFDAMGKYSEIIHNFISNYPKLKNDFDNNKQPTLYIKSVDELYNNAEISPAAYKLQNQTAKKLWSTMHCYFVDTAKRYMPHTNQFKVGGALWDLEKGVERIDF